MDEIENIKKRYEARKTDMNQSKYDLDNRLLVSRIVISYTHLSV